MVNNPNLYAIIMPTRACNLECDYCYILKKDQIKMSFSHVEHIISELLQYNNPLKLTRKFWHGGEPMLAGIEFYKYVCDMVKKKYPNHNIRPGNRHF
jgi:uncharacterized protein